MDCINCFVCFSENTSRSCLACQTFRFSCNSRTAVSKSLFAPRRPMALGPTLLVTNWSICPATLMEHCRLAFARQKDCVKFCESFVCVPVFNSFVCVYCRIDVCILNGFSFNFFLKKKPLKRLPFF